MRLSSRTALPVCLLVALALGGCGLGAGSAPTRVDLLVSSDFGAHVARHVASPRVGGEQTVMSLLMGNATVKARYGGGFVQSIDGLGGARPQGGSVDWFYYVNGVEAPKGAAETVVHPGDHIWWDRHDWSQTEDIPAVVGSYPQPFLNGIDGKRLPVRVECAEAEGEACRTVTDRLRADGVHAALSALGGGEGPLTLRVFVGPWAALAGRPGTAEIEQGPRNSGVYARFVGDGHKLALLDAGGRTTRTLAAGAGLIAATRYAHDAPLWVITGTDDRGVALAAQALDRTTLAAHFAVALTGSSKLPIPEPGP